ncbi:MAG: hypothetical protein GX271_11495, partial [Clostridiales bacterium]|nr:hypothetical protein [Clostridiales bacterium]
MKNKTSIRLILIMSFVLIALFSLGCKKNSNDDKGIKDPVTNTSDLDDIDLDEEKKDSNIVDTKDTNDDIGKTDENDDKKDIKEENLLPAIHYGDVQIETEIILSEDFETGETAFKGRGAATTELISDQAYSDSHSLLTSGRTAHWNGPIIELTESIIPGEIYSVKAYVFYEDGPESVQIDCMIEFNGNQYYNVGSTMAYKGEWTELNGRITIPKDMETVSFYFENRYDASIDDIKDFYIDDLVITRESTTVVRGEIPAIKDVYKDYFTIGVAATIPEAQESRQGMIKEQFNSFTTGNELKPDSLLDYEKSIS